MKKILCLVLAAVLMSAVIVYLQFGPAHKRLSPDSSLTQTIASMKNVVIYEGLPHPRWEPNLLEREAKSKQTVTIGDFLFYATPLHPNANDLDVIISSLQNPKLYQAWVGPKACGGFHPDFAVTWENGLGQFTAQLCYGCEEIKIDGPGYHAYLDLAKNEELEAALKKNAVNRPPGGRD